MRVENEAVADSGAGQVDDEVRLRLRAAVQALRTPKAPVRAAAPVSSVFGRAAATLPHETHPPAGRLELVTRFNDARAKALPGTTLALIVVPDRQVAREMVLACRQLIAGGAVVLMVGPDLSRAVGDRTHPLTVPLRADDSLSEEWGLISCGPTGRRAFLARHEPGGRNEWRWLETEDSIAVHRAAMGILERVPFLRLRVPVLTG